VRIYSTTADGAKHVIEIDDAKHDWADVCNAIGERFRSATKLAQGCAAGVRDTSLAAYRGLQQSGELTRQQREIFAFITSGTRSDWTRKEISEACGIPINAVAGRVHELVEKGKLEELPRRACRITGEQAHPLRARGLLI
jgi:hypothetical protein